MTGCNYMGKSVGLNTQLTRNVGVQQAHSLKEMRVGEEEKV